MIMDIPKIYKEYIYVTGQFITRLIKEQVTQFQIVQQAGVSVQGIANPF
jgi:hypothetical protein